MSSEDSNYFFVILPSNVSDYPEQNRSNHYRVHLPKPIKFQGGNWFCGLYSISYINSWNSTLGTFEDQWIDIFFKNNEKLRIFIPKTSQNNAETLCNFLNAAIATSLKEPKPRTKRQINPNDNYVAEFFRKNPVEYWDHINDEKKAYQDLQKELEEKTNEHAKEKDVSKKRKLLETLTDFVSHVDYKKARLAMLEEEAKKRDAERKSIEAALIERFFESFPDNYNEKLGEQRLKLTSLIIELQTKLEEYKGIQDVNEMRNLNEVTKNLRIQINHLRGHLDVLVNAALERDKNKTREEYVKQAWIEHQNYVIEFFNKNVNYWPAIHRNFQDLQPLYAQLREKNEKLKLETTNSQEKEDINKEIKDIQKLIDYRSKRFLALDFEARKRDLEREKEEHSKQKRAEESPTSEALKSHADILIEKLNNTEHTRDHADVLIDKLGQDQSTSTTDHSETRDYADVLIDNLGQDQDRTTDHADQLLQIIEEGNNKKDNADKLIDILKIGGITSDLIEFQYLKPIDRFKINFKADKINYIILSEQLSYVIGFNDRDKIYNNEIGKYGIDLKGGYTSFAVYSKGLTKSLIVGNSLSSLLRMVSVEGQYGSAIERIYDHPMYIPVLPREINELEIELKMLNGKPVPFEFGIVTVVLVFKRVINI